MSNLESRHPDDAVPPAQEREPFPMGDIGIDEFFKKQNELLKLQAAWDQEDFDRSIRFIALREEKSSSGSMYHEHVVAGYKELAVAWPEAFGIRPYSRGRRIARRTVFATQSFVNDVLPPIKHNFEEDFELMAGFSITEIKDFTVGTWDTMDASHPDIHYLLINFGELLAGRTCVSEQEYRLTMSCVALPYILSSNSRLLELSQQEAA